MRQPNWDIDRTRGEEGEQLVQRLRSRLLNSECEVKVDEQALETGNIYVEYECCHQDGKWHRSGISATRALTYVFVIPPALIAMPTWVLKNIARPLIPTNTKSCTRGSHPTRGVVIPVDSLLQRTWSFWSAQASDKPTPILAPWEGETLPTAQQGLEYRTTGTFKPDPEGWQS